MAFDPLSILDDGGHLINAGRQARLLDRFGQKTDAMAEDFRDSTSQRSQSKQLNSGGRVELYGEVDVTGCLGVTTSTRTEQREATDAAWRRSASCAEGW